MALRAAATLRRCASAARSAPASASIQRYVASAATLPAAHRRFRSRTATPRWIPLATAAAAAAALTAAEVHAEDDKDEKDDDPAGPEPDDDDGGDSDKVGFRERKFRNYENRIRTMSNPDKIFRYFATVEVDGVQYMRMADFLRAVTTDAELQPREYGLDRFQKLSGDAGRVRGDPSKIHFLQHGPDGTLLDDNMQCGLISYPEFVFLLTALTASRRQFELAFRMFDLDGNGVVDLAEFSKVQAAIQSTASRNLASRSSSTVSADLLERSLMLMKFFGRKGTGHLKLQEFLAFLDKLQYNLLHIDFLHYNEEQADRSRIGAPQLAEFILNHARVSAELRPAMIERVEAALGETTLGYDETFDFFVCLRAMDDMQRALKYWSAAGVDINEADFMRAAKAASGVVLSKEMVHFIFVMFDQDGDGKLNESEFIKVMKKASIGVGAAQPKRNIEVSKGFAALLRCIRIQMIGQ
eukprot:m.224427 g.224427  ORF g.224427 m.224427 type:complete len:469 (+) comp10830_c0_seq1:2018-3424(+)